jgi:SWI/SNF-related matrix-associated actin-dependent regulator of chromatin subfamily E, member 1
MMQPLVLSSHGHPAYLPSKLNIKTATDMKLSKTKPPEKPILPYMRYSRKVWDNVKASHPEAKLWEVGKIVGQMWRDLSHVEKQEYNEEYENAKNEYCEQLKNYHNSPQYQNYLSSAARRKNRDGSIMNSAGGGQFSSNITSNNILNTINRGVGNISNGIDPTSFNCAIEPAEDDGLDEGLTNRHVATVRYQRNQRLLNEIFNEYAVQDTRYLVTDKRIAQLKNQVTELEVHQEKLNKELTTLQNENEIKKRKIVDSTTSFQNELNKLKDFKVSEEQEKAFHDKHYDLLQKQWQESIEKVKNQKLSPENERNVLKDTLNNIIGANRSVISIPVPSPVTVVVLQQVEVPSAAVPTPTTTTTTQPKSTAAVSVTAPPNQLAPNQQISPSVSTAQSQAPVTHHQQPPQSASTNPHTVVPPNQQAPHHAVNVITHHQRQPSPATTTNPNVHQSSPHPQQPPHYPTQNHHYQQQTQPQATVAASITVPAGTIGPQQQQQQPTIPGQQPPIQQSTDFYSKLNF